jgi:hypothetical protein
MAKTRAQQAAIAISMKKAGKKPKMQNGGTPSITMRKVSSNDPYEKAKRDYEMKKLTLDAKHKMDKLKASKKMQDGGSTRSVQGAPKPAKLTPSQTMKTVRWDGGNTGLQVPSYMVNETGNPLPQYEATVKDRLKKAGKLSFGGTIKKK